MNGKQNSLPIKSVMFNLRDTGTSGETASESGFMLYDAIIIYICIIPLCNRQLYIFIVSERVPNNSSEIHARQARCQSFILSYLATT